ncbi:MAG: hypothetical protein WD847_04890 [Pirellulales bacterium]
MSQSKLHEASLPGAVEGETVEYRPLCVAAIAGLAAGLASPLAFVHPLFWSVPLLAVVISVAALVRIRRHEPKLIGRRAAVAGLVIALCCGTPATTYWAIYQWHLRSQAGVICHNWFNLMRGGEPHKAHQLTVKWHARLPLDDNLWAHYAGREDLYSVLRTFTDEPIVRALLELGPDAEVRFYKTESVSAHQGQEIVKQLYAVSFRRDGKLRSFFITITATRIFDNRSRSHAWVINAADMLFRVPDDLPDTSSG